MGWESPPTRSTHAVDAEARVRAFLPRLDEFVSEGLVIFDEVDVIRYVDRKADR